LNGLAVEREALFNEEEEDEGDGVNVMEIKEEEDEFEETENQVIQNESFTEELKEIGNQET